MIASAYLLLAFILYPFLAHPEPVQSAPTEEQIAEAQMLAFRAVDEARAEDSSRLASIREARWKEAGISSRAVDPLTFENVKPSHAVGVYMTAKNVKETDFLDRTIAAIKESGGTALVFDVKEHGVYFDSLSPLATELGIVQPQYKLQEVLKKAKDNDLYTIARFVALKDDGLTKKRPDTLLKDPRTGNSMSPGWADPQNPVTIRYNTELVCELAQSGLDEINLDYIRYSTAYHGELGAFTGKEKAERLEAYIKAIRETIDRCGPETKLGVSTFAILGWAYDINLETLGQDVAHFAPLVDIISPMAYPQTFTSGYYIPGRDPRSAMYYLVNRTLRGYQEFLGPHHGAKLRPWIQGYSIDAQDAREQIDAVTDAGICGFQFWNAPNNYGPVYQALQNWERPGHCL